MDCPIFGVALKWRRCTWWWWKGCLLFRQAGNHPPTQCLPFGPTFFPSSPRQGVATLRVDVGYASNSTALCGWCTAQWLTLMSALYSAISLTHLLWSVHSFPSIHSWEPGSWNPSIYSAGDVLLLHRSLVWYNWMLISRSFAPLTNENIATKNHVHLQKMWGRKGVFFIAEMMSSHVCLHFRSNPKGSLAIVSIFDY